VETRQARRAGQSRQLGRHARHCSEDRFAGEAGKAGREVRVGR
jgi:hypothetical protein